MLNVANALPVLLRRYGPLARVEIKRNYAFVEYKEVDDAIEAQKRSHGGLMGGRTITVEFVESSRERGGGRYGLLRLLLSSNAMLCGVHPTSRKHSCMLCFSWFLCTMFLCRLAHLILLGLRLSLTANGCGLDSLSSSLTCCLCAPACCSQGPLPLTWRPPPLTLTTPRRLASGARLRPRLASPPLSQPCAQAVSFARLHARRQGWQQVARRLQAALAIA